MGKTWGDDRLRELNRTAQEKVSFRTPEQQEVWEGHMAAVKRAAEEHAMAAHVDEALNTHELYDQDDEPIENAVTILPSRCGLCGTLFENPPWDATQGSRCSVCGATTKVAR